MPKRVTFDDWDDEDRTSKPSRKHRHGCSDKSCGALDCRTCHPENFDKHGFYLEPPDEPTQDQA